MSRVCSALGVFLLLAAAILGIFINISQISTSQRVPRSLRLASLETSQFGTGLTAASGSTPQNLTFLYGAGPRQGGANQGIAAYYSFGLWAYCGATGSNNNADYCTSTSFGNQFQPALALLSDVPQQQLQAVYQVLPSDSTFVASGYTGDLSKIAFYLIFIGTILAGAGLLISITLNRFASLLGALFAFLAFMCLGAGATIWTIMISKIKSSINSTTVTGGTPLGLYVDYGNCLWLLWAATGATLLAVLPLLIACCTGGRHKYDEDQPMYGGGSQYRGSQYGGSQLGARNSVYSTGGRSAKRSSRYEPSIRY